MDTPEFGGKTGRSARAVWSNWWANDELSPPLLGPPRAHPEGWMWAWANPSELPLHRLMSTNDCRGGDRTVQGYWASQKQCAKKRLPLPSKFRTNFFFQAVDQPCCPCSFFMCYLVVGATRESSGTVVQAFVWDLMDDIVITTWRIWTVLRNVGQQLSNEFKKK